MVLAVEVEDLGIAAGPQDRYAQAHEGLVLMDFAGARPRVERLDPALLPSLYLAWRSDAAEASHAVHGDLRDRARDPAVRAGMARLAGHARAARDALLGGDQQAFAAALDASFDERAAAPGPRSAPRGDGARRPRRRSERQLRRVGRGNCRYSAS